MDNMDVAMTMNNEGEMQPVGLIDRDNTVATPWQGDQTIGNTGNTTNYRQPVVNYVDTDCRANADRIYKPKVSYRKMLSLILCVHKRQEYAHKLEASDRRINTKRSQCNVIMAEINRIDQKYIANGAYAKPSVICNQMVAHALAGGPEATTAFVKQVLNNTASPQLITDISDDINAVSEQVAKLSKATMSLFREQYERGELSKNIRGYTEKQDEDKYKILDQLGATNVGFGGLLQ